MIKKFLAVFLFLFSTLSFSVETSESWSTVLSVVHQVRDLLEIESPESWRVDQVKEGVHKLNANPIMVSQFLNKAYGIGLLHTDQFKRDLGDINRQLADPEKKEKVTQLLKSLEFDKVAIQFADIPQRVIEPSVDETGFDTESDDASTFQVPGAEKAVTLEERARSQIKWLQEAIQEMLEAQHAFAISGNKLEARIWWIQTIAAAIAATSGLILAANWLHIEDMQPREMIAWTGGVLGGPLATHLLVWGQKALP